METIQWLLVGGPAHGRTLWIKAGTSVQWGADDGTVYLYEGRDFAHGAVRGALYRIGVCTGGGDVDMDQVPRLIAETGLQPHWNS